ncbi:MAG: hypothetical protein KAW41_04140 [Candidatus Diapherotrites archaeon]|nr:hypothetical protein [Candidatus Diapherotrites archaeon]
MPERLGIKITPHGEYHELHACSEKDAHVRSDKIATAFTGLPKPVKPGDKIGDFYMGVSVHKKTVQFSNIFPTYSLSLKMRGPSRHGKVGYEPLERKGIMKGVFLHMLGPMLEKKGKYTVKIESTEGMLPGLKGFFGRHSINVDDFRNGKYTVKQFHDLLLGEEHGKN